MSAAAKRAPPQWLSTHPASAKRVTDMKSQMHRVLPLYARATNRDPNALPAYRSSGEDVGRPPVQKTIAP